MSSTSVAVGSKLGFDSVDGTVSRALLGTLDLGLDCVIADCVPAAFVVAHLGEFFVLHLCMYSPLRCFT